MEDHPSPEVIIVHFRYRHGWKGGRWRGDDLPDDIPGLLSVGPER